MDSLNDKQNRSIARMAIDGYVVVDHLLQADEIDRVDESLRGIDVEAAGDRRFLDREWCRLLAHVIRHRLLKMRLLYRASQPVLCTYFRKDPGSTGSVSLHRELHVPLAARCDSTQFSNWTEKQGIPHARATRDLLATMLVVHVHVDAGEIGDGELCVVPGSHDGADADAERVACTASRGGAIVLSPLLLHASPPSASLKPHRVLHFLFGPGDLPGGARWYY
ncbi:MAG: phytanoyl-CoA dioxygenase family protein [Gammaproteobacteria bacterium]|jgi:hypothetical protein